MLDDVLEFLQNTSLIKAIEIQTLPNSATQSTYHLFDYLINQQLLSSTALFVALAKKFSLPTVDLTNFAQATKLNTHALDLVHYQLLPLTKNANLLSVATCYPCSLELQSLLRFQTGCELEFKLAEFKQLRLQLKQSQVRPFISANIKKSDAHNDPLIDEPLVQFVDTLLMDAYRQQISDIHIEPLADQARIRFRLDGLLHEKLIIAFELYQRIISRLKILAHLDIAEKRLPQDGRIQFKEMAIRINTCPTIHGEKIVLRLQHRQSIQCQISNLNLLPAQEKKLLETIDRPQGLILVTGPTGSGKTQTLYSILNYLNTKARNCCTVEDPVEIQLDGINQINIQPAIGFDFAHALRAFLRQDPDIIMLGEIRDAESAHIAFLAAQTGHLVLATLHTNSATETLQRLQGLGIQQSQAEGLTLVINQRLLRKICKICNAQQHCSACQHGYAGRIGIYELWSPQENIECISLQQVARNYVSTGLTTMAEVKRVLGSLESA